MTTFLCPLRVEQQKMPRLEGIGGSCTSLLTQGCPSSYLQALVGQQLWELQSSHF